MESGAYKPEMFPLSPSPHSRMIIWFIVRQLNSERWQRRVVLCCCMLVKPGSYVP